MKTRLYMINNDGKIVIDNGRWCSGVDWQKTVRKPKSLMSMRIFSGSKTTLLTGRLILRVWLVEQDC